jgi:glycosyltransferase involved in cell wall biosynthesis
MTSQLRIGFLTPEYVFDDRKDGGLANYLHKITWALAQRHHRVSVFVLSNRNNLSKDGEIEVIEVKRPNKLQLPQWINYKLERFLPLLEALRAAKRIEKAVWEHHRKSPLDILQTASYSAPGFSLRRNGKIPIVCRISAYTPLLRSAYGRRRQFGEYLTDWLEIRQVLDADASFSPSEFISNHYERMEGFKPPVLRSPVDTRNIELDHSLFQEQFSSFRYFVFVGTLSKTKGVDLLADAIPDFLKAHPEIHFVFIGRDAGIPGYPSSMNYVNLKCKGFEKNIHYLPALAKSRLYPIMSHALAVVIPSRVDNYPNVCIEAHAMNVPVIGTNNSSLEEMIQDEETGFLIQNSNASDLARALGMVAELSPEKRQQIKENIRKQIQSIENEDRIEQLILLYTNTIRKFSPISA